MSQAYLHFVGKNLYGAEKFSIEATKLGIQRAVQYFVIRQMNFGDKVSLAFRDGATRKDKGATIFGSSIITGVSYTGAPEDLIDGVRDQLDVVQVLEGTGPEERECGQYSIAASYVVTNTIEEIMEAIRQAAEKRGLNPAAFKFFVRGAFVPLSPTMTLPDQGFFRGFKRMETDNAVATKTGKKTLTILTDYKRQYTPRKNKDIAG